MREIWLIYEGAWNEIDPGKRKAILEKTLGRQFVYSDPLMRTEGLDQLSDYIGQTQLSVPGMRIATEAFVQHHESCLVRWTMQDGSGKAVANGVTCGELDGEGLLRKATVFFG